MTWLFRLFLFFGLPSWGVYVFLAGLIASSYGYVYLQGRHDANANCDAATLRFQLSLAQEDLKNAKRANEIEDKLSDDLQKKVIKYAEELRARPNPACTWTAPDLVRGR